MFDGMMHLRLMSFVTLFFTLVSVSKNNPDIKTNGDKEKYASKISKIFQNESATFEQNNGQYDAAFNYRFSNSNACVDFYEDRVEFSLRKVTQGFDPVDIEKQMKFEYVRWAIDLNASSAINHVGELTKQNVNFFRQNSTSIGKYVADGIVYERIYPNIDLKFYTSENGELKYDFILHKGAKLADIKLSYTGVEELKVNEAGQLIYETKWGAITEEKPYSYRSNGGEEVRIDYISEGNNLTFDADFEIASEEIILDPIYVDWSTYFYGTGRANNGFGFTRIFDLDIDDQNHVYVTGNTNDRFPVTVGAYDTSSDGSYDAFVCKMSPAGDSIVWFSYFGGSNFDYCLSMAVNSAQEPVVSGFTWSPDFPFTTGAFDTIANTQDGFSNRYSGYVTKFSKNGDALIFSTFLGGTGNNLIQSMVLDDQGYIYMTGQTNAADYPTTPGAYQTTYGGTSSSSGWWRGGDAFVTKMKPDGTDLVFSTFIGGSLDDVAYGISLSPSNEVYIVGKTSSTNFPTTPGSRVFNFRVTGISDGFITKLNAAGSILVYSKLMGGSGEDWFEGVYVNQGGEAYVAGISRSSDFYTSSNAFQKSSNGGADAVVVKIANTGAYVWYSTYLGGSGDELYSSGFIYNSNVRIAANIREEAIVCGISRSLNFPVTSDALQTTNPGSGSNNFWNSSATIAKLDYRGEKLLYGTYYGGSGFELPGANKLKRISCFTNILYGGFTRSIDYPTTPGVYKENGNSLSNGFAWSGFISKFRDTLYTEPIALGIGDSMIECDEVFEILDASNIGADFLWSTGATEQFIFAEDTGVYWVQATYGCDTVRDSIHFKLEYSPKLPVLPDDSTYCDVFPVLDLDVENDTVLATYLWQNGDTTSTQRIDTMGTYWVDIITPNCGIQRDEVVYRKLNTPDASLPKDSLFCGDVDLLLQPGDSADNEEIYVWHTQDSSATFYVDTVGTYGVRISNYCGTDTSTFVSSQLQTPVLSLPADSVFCDSVAIDLVFGQVNNEEIYLFKNLETNLGLGLVTNSIQITEAGQFEISIENRCSTVLDTIELALLYSPTVSLGNDSILCDQVDLTLEVGRLDNDESYDWSSDLSNKSNTYRVDQVGDYGIIISNKCGTAFDEISFEMVKSPVVQLPQDTTFCDQVDLLLDATMADEDCDYEWNTTAQDPTIQVDETGTYRVTLTNYCGVATDSIQVGLITTPRVDLGFDEIFCNGVESMSYTVGKADNQEVYLWSSGSGANQESFSQVGTHWVRLTNKCAVVTDSINFSVSNSPEVALGTDTTLCGDFSITLDAGNPGMTYLWMPYGETTQTIQAQDQTEYSVIVYNDNGCEGRDEFEIRSDCISTSFLPSAFSPNGDGLNDLFRPTLVNYEQFEMEIYNRWGELLFKSTDASIGWDGTYKGEVVPNGVYTYYMIYRTTEDMQWQNVGGVLNVIR